MSSVIWLDERQVVAIGRFTCLIAAIIGATLGWLCAAIVFLNGFRDAWSTVFLSLSVFYTVTLWGTRRWPALRTGLLFTVFGGGILGATLCPSVSRVFVTKTLLYFGFWIPMARSV